MTTIIDTSVWIALFRDKSGHVANEIRKAVGQDVVATVGPVRLELLQGCRNDNEWRSVEQKLSALDEVEFPPAIWTGAARIYFELRQRGATVRSALDCCIAELCLQNNCMLLHNDRDFEAIATIRPLKHVRLSTDKAIP
jgi:predicted nucleic acid-binding protein